MSDINPAILRVYLKHSPALAELLRRLKRGYATPAGLARAMCVSRQRVNQLIEKALARGLLTERPFPYQPQKAHARFVARD